MMVMMIKYYNLLVHVTACHDCAVSVSIVIGIPTVKRDSVSYVAQTIDSLIKGMTTEEQDDCLIVVFVAEVKCLSFLSSFMFTSTCHKST